MSRNIKQQLTTDEIDELLSKPWLHVPKAGAILGLNRSASYEAARRGEIETFRIGRLLKAPTAFSLPPMTRGILLIWLSLMWMAILAILTGTFVVLFQ